ncbi:PIGT family protein [Megaselia abdita]
MFSRLKFCFLILVISVNLSEQSEQYHEELFIKPLPNGFVNTFFQFTTRWNMASREDLLHTKLTPRPIAEVLYNYDVKELNIALTQGLWRYELWGYPVVDSAPGAEAWAWFNGDNLTESHVSRQWKDLTSTFSGILCASLNNIDEANTVQPKYSFRPRFVAPKNTKSFIKYSTLPRENVCTENLTPWKKLLPCSSEQGFASLLNSGYVHNTNYHSVKVAIRTFQEAKTGELTMELVLSANLVFDPILISSSKDYSIRKIFGQGLNGVCPMSSSSKIYVDITEDKFELVPDSDDVKESTRGASTTKFAIYDMKVISPNDLFNIAFVKKDKQNLVPIIPPPILTAHRYILAKGQEEGKIMTEVTNNHWADLNVVLQENIPWFVPSYMHTLTVKNGNEVLKIKEFHYIPGNDRERPYHLEIAFTVPAKSTVKVYFDFDYIFLKWTEYPPDANHGHYIGSAVVTALLPVAKNYTTIPVEGYLFEHSFNASRPSYFIQIHTESLLLSLPTPDFSMPYNVICLTCTVIALAFGPIHSVTTKILTVDTDGDENKGFIKKVIGKIRDKIKGKKSAPKESVEEKPKSE